MTTQEKLDELIARYDLLLAILRELWLDNEGTDCVIEACVELGIDINTLVDILNEG